MKDSLRVGLTHSITYTVPESKTVPHVYEDSSDFAVMPRVFATAFLVGLLERCCLESLIPHLDWPEEQSVGTHVDVSHTAATPPGLTVTVQSELVEIDRNRLVFHVSAHDGVDPITSGRHERFIIDAATFNAS
ncbi:MAG: thioesterase family protein, partial [Acidimicrobiales bacterium]